MIRNDLLRLQSEGKPIRVGASAIDWMGSGFVTALAHVPGMELVVLANEDISEASEAFLSTGLQPDDLVETDKPAAAVDAIRAGKRVITSDPTLPAKVDDVDIVSDATWSPAIGALVAESSIQQGKDVVMVNIEADVTVGRILRQLAEEVGVVYSVSSGDEPGCLMELFDFVGSLGYQVITIGKGKNNPLDPSATPEMVAESARRDGKDPYQVASYVDGTKTMFEMACAANATGCRPMQRGMMGPEATLDDVSEVFALEADGGLSRFAGNVDFVQGSAMAGGVFVTVKVEDKRIRDDLNYLKVGSGNYFTFFRPYHLWFLEAPISIATVFLRRQPWMAPLPEPVAEVMAVAKRGLESGETLERFGGGTHHGVIDLADEALRLEALPIGLAEGARLRRSLETGDIVRWDDVELDESSAVVRLRRLQDEQLPFV